MDTKNQSYYAKLTGFAVGEPVLFEGPIITIVSRIAIHMASQISLGGKHGEKQWTIMVQAKPFEANVIDSYQHKLGDLNAQALAMFKDDIPTDDEPRDNENPLQYYERRMSQFNDTPGVAQYMVNEYFYPEANVEIKAFRADPSAIRFLELDSGIGKDELPEEYGSLRLMLKVKYQTIWPSLNLRRS